MEDVLAHILSRLDNSTIANLKGSSLWESVVQVAEGQEFWRLRCENLLKRKLPNPETTESWKEVYYVLEEAIRTRTNPFYNKRITIGVLLTKVLLFAGYSPTSQGDSAVARQIREGTIEDVEELLTDKVLTAIGGYKKVITLAITARRLDMLDYFFHKYYDKDMNWTLVASIHNPEIMKFVLSSRRVDPAKLTDSEIRTILSKGILPVLNLLLADGRIDFTAEGKIDPLSSVRDIQVARLLLQDPRINPDKNKGVAIHNAVLTGNTNLVKLLLEDSRVIPRPDTLQEAILRGNASVLKLLLDSGRVDPEELKESPILLAMKSRDKATIALILADKRVVPTIEDLTEAILSNNKLVVESLLRDQRIDLNQASINLLELTRDREILRLVTTAVTQAEDKLLGSISAYRYISQDESCTRSLTVRDRSVRELLKLLIRRPAVGEANTLSNILKWLIRKNERVIGLAAYDWRYGETSYIHSPVQTAYYAVICLVDKNRSFLDILEELEEAGASDEGVDLAARLLGAYYGASKLGVPTTGRACLGSRKTEMLRLLN